MLVKSAIDQGITSHSKLSFKEKPLLLPFFKILLKFAANIDARAINDDNDIFPMLW